MIIEIIIFDFLQLQPSAVKHNSQKQNNRKGIRLFISIIPYFCSFINATNRLKICFYLML